MIKWPLRKYCAISFDFRPHTKGQKEREDNFDLLLLFCSKKIKKNKSKVNLILLSIARVNRN